MKKHSKLKKSKISKMSKISLFRLLIMSAKAAPLLSFMVVFLGALLGVSWAANTLFTQRLFDTASAKVNKEASARSLVWALAMLGLVNMFNQFVNCFNNISHRFYETKLTGFFSGLLHEKIGCLPALYFENTGVLNDIDKAGKGKDNVAFTMLILLLLMGFYLPYLLFMFFYLFSLQPLLAVILPAAFVPTVLFQFSRAKAYYKLEDKAAPFRRENEYYARCIISREYFKETRLLGGVNYFRKRFLETQKLLHKAVKQAETEISKQELLYKLFTVLGYLFALLLLLFLLMKKAISVGAFAAVFASMGSLYSIIEEIIIYNVAHVSKELGSIRHFMAFLDTPVPAGNVEKLSNDNISVENICFSYPNMDTNMDRNVIKNVSFSIRKGETVAIVGRNGSGKTTLVKLLTGLYHPDSGSVMYDGIDTRQFSPDSMSLKLSGVFQTYRRYQMTLRDNVEISQLNKQFNSQLKKQAGDSQLRKALHDAGIDPGGRIFADGYDTMLSREFNGIDLSGGEWQRVAIARGLYRDHDIIVLDEPTAAIDPIEEAATYKRFAAISSDKTVIIVTHRLGSVKFADKILVMKDGGIVEAGTHSDLLEKNGEYAYIFRSQSQWYR